MDTTTSINTFPKASYRRSLTIQSIYSIKSYGALTGNAAGDKALVDWLVKEYRKAL